MPEQSLQLNSIPSNRNANGLNPLSYLKRKRDERFLRERDDLRRYLESALPLAEDVDRLYREWRKAVQISEPIKDCQKAANVTAIYWWQITERLRVFREYVPPKTGQRYHNRFMNALTNASVGTEILKNGFRFNKFADVSRGIGYLDEYLKSMSQAEAEMGRLLRKYRFIDDE
ncbi:MAG: hypothetical protein ACOX87_09415 [Chloroflexota bacterium]|jgi:hypothetical protein